MYAPFKIELFKVWKRPLFLLCLFGPILLFGYQYFLVEGLDNKIASWQRFFRAGYTDVFVYYILSFSKFYYLAILLLISYTYFALEYKNRNYISLFTLPERKAGIYNAKVSVLCLYSGGGILLLYGLFFCLFLFSGQIERPPVSPFVSMWLGLVLIVVFQFAMAHLLRSFALYMLVFIFLFAGALLYQGDFRYLNPYHLFNPVIASEYDVKITVFQLAYILVSYLLGWVAFKRLAYGKQSESSLDRHV